jgi:hypothetical protein
VLVVGVGVYVSVSVGVGGGVCVSVGGGVCLSVVVGVMDLYFRLISVCWIPIYFCPLDFHPVNFNVEFL